VSVQHAPLCDAGRCAQLVEGLALAKRRMVDSQGAQLAAVLAEVAEDAELGLDGRQREVWPAVVTRAVGRLFGLAAEPSKVIEGSAA